MAAHRGTDLAARAADGRLRGRLYAPRRTKVAQVSSTFRSLATRSFARRLRPRAARPRLTSAHYSDVNPQTAYRVLLVLSTGWWTMVVVVVVVVVVQARA
jgi:hypothetical protein